VAPRATKSQSTPTSRQLTTFAMPTSPEAIGVSITPPEGELEIKGPNFAGFVPLCADGTSIVGGTSIDTIDFGLAGFAQAAAADRNAKALVKPSFPRRIKTDWVGLGCSSTTCRFFPSRWASERGARWLDDFHPAVFDGHSVVSFPKCYEK